MASSNLQNYAPTKHANSDWNLWVSLVKKAHKLQGIHLTQAQTLMVAKNSYPGKNNVLKDTDPATIPTLAKEEIPANPPRRKKQPAPTRAPPKLETRERSPPRRRSSRREPVGPDGTGGKSRGRPRYDDRYDDRYSHREPVVGGSGHYDPPVGGDDRYMDEEKPRRESRRRRRDEYSDDESSEEERQSHRDKAPYGSRRAARAPRRRDYDDY